MHLRTETDVWYDPRNLKLAAAVRKYHKRYAAYARLVNRTAHWRQNFVKAFFMRSSFIFALIVFIAPGIILLADDNWFGWRLIAAGVVLDALIECFTALRFRRLRRKVREFPSAYFSSTLFPADAAWIELDAELEGAGISLHDVIADPELFLATVTTVQDYLDDVARARHQLRLEEDAPDLTLIDARRIIHRRVGRCADRIEAEHRRLNHTR